MDINLAEEGILRLLFTSVYRIFFKVGSDSEVALASRYGLFAQETLLIPFRNSIVNELKMLCS